MQGERTYYILYIRETTLFNPSLFFCVHNITHDRRTTTARSERQTCIAHTDIILIQCLRPALSLTHTYVQHNM